MLKSRRWVLPAIALALLLLVETVVVWQPFGFNVVSYTTGWKDKQVAGQILGDFHLTQTVPADLFKLSQKRRKSIHWHNPQSLAPWTQPDCFTLRFASYDRANTGRIRVGWTQGAASQQWQLDAADLDNAFAYFCPKQALDTARAFQITIDGVNSPSGHAATVWLAHSKLPPAVVNGTSIDERGLILQLAHQHAIGPAVISGLDHGAFLFGCLCSLGIGLLAILAIRRKDVSEKLGG